MDQSNRISNTDDDDEEDEENDDDSNSDYSQDFQQSDDCTSSDSSISDHTVPLCPAEQLLLAKRNNKNTYDHHSAAKVLINDSNNSNNTNHNTVKGTNHQTRTNYQPAHKTSVGRMDSLFMQERLSEEDEELDQDDRPIRGTMKIREDTMDGAENPDTDPPQRRKTLEDISITELSSLGSPLPPEYPDDQCPPTLLPCLTCNRTFNMLALDRHRKVCQKLSQTGKKKQIFNPLKQRFECPDDPPPPGSARARTPERKNTPPSKKQSRWREKHKEFLRTIRAARGAPEGDSDAGGPVSTVPSDYVHCPHCERHFGPKAAERHIDWCREQSNRLRRNSADTQLVERLKTRTKYVPPKPGQSGWRAPKKTDVISSIPPPSATVGGDRRISPPPIHPMRRGTSPGPAQQRQYSTGSLGRAAARSYSSLVQAVTNSYSSPYGQRGSVTSTSGYATPSSYSAYGGTGGGGCQTPNLVRSGSFSGTTPGGTFARSQSLRVPGTRRSSGGRIARRRDLASDMLASVCLGGSPARGEPEGDEADDFSSRETTLSPPPCNKSLIDSKFDSSFENDYSSKYDSEFGLKFDDLKQLEGDSKYDPVIDTSYDPYSAAEMQMQALLGPNKASLGSGGLGAAGMGLGSLGSFIEENNNQKNLSSTLNSKNPKSRLSKLNINLSPAPRRTQASPGSARELLSSSPKIDYNHQSRLWRLSPSPPPQRMDRWSPSPQSPSHVWSPTRTSPSRDDRLSVTSLSAGSRDGRYSASSGNTSHRDDRGLSPSISNREDRFSLSSGSGSIREDRFSSGSLNRDSRFSSISSGSYRSDRFSPSSLREDRLSTSSGNTAIHRTLGNGAADTSSTRKSSAEDSLFSNNSSLSFLKTLKSGLKSDTSIFKKDHESVNENVEKTSRTSSGSSTDSSLPQLSSPTSSVYTKVSRGETVGGHGDDAFSSTPRITPTLSATRTERSFLSKDVGSTNSSHGDTLEKAISSLSSIGNSSTKPSGGLTTDSSVPKFCHECGNKYPVNLAKFCCQCGCRRAPLDH